jgi:antitoxin MazE
MQRIEVKLKKWGNSLAVRLPKEITSNVDIHENSKVELNVVDNNIVMSPIKKTKITLDEILEGITPETYGKVIDFGSPVGKEIW